ncbi:hypothetical protein JB92DRAFT_3173596 [Gautieria morchelliformis]|nr:hypothetical protein JB92DRAFT_3173596 [Gautieria morchelliformis]
MDQPPERCLHGSLRDSLRFARFAILLKPAISFQQLDVRSPPSELPLHVHMFLCEALGWGWPAVAQFWQQLCEEVWNESEVAATVEDIRAFRQYGLLHGIGETETNTTLTLRQPSLYDATLFTKASGALPIFSHSLYCPNCHIHYHPNFSVSKATSMRTYYHGVPDVVQVSQHHFFESALLELQATEMCFAWVSSTNCARVYNKALGPADAHQSNNPGAYPDGGPPSLTLPTDWTSSMSMNSADVLDGFFLFSLLLEKAEKGECLVLIHDASSQRLHLEGAMQERNAAIEGFGQELYNHACDLLFDKLSLIFHFTPVKLQGAVSDGNAMGHPCCAVHDCKIALGNTNRDMYCPVHLGRQAKCAVISCDMPHAEHFLTCDQGSHRSLEQVYKQKQKAFFHFRNRIAKGPSLHSVTTDSGPFVGGPACESKPLQGNRRIHAQFGRRRTHNEQLLIRPCGVIISRGPFFGSEAISAVREFVLATFPTRESMPEVFFYDSNCNLLKHIRHTQCRHFDDTAVVVNVFHFKSKHKESNGFCQENCNPALYLELYEDGEWIFNSSIAEQTNVWFGGFLAIVREMTTVRFNFYLDEMIKRRNRHVVAELERKGHQPWRVPWAALFPADGEGKEHGKGRVGAGEPAMGQTEGRGWYGMVVP